MTKEKTPKELEAMITTLFSEVEDLKKVLGGLHVKVNQLMKKDK